VLVEHVVREALVGGIGDDWGEGVTELGAHGAQVLLAAGDTDDGVARGDEGGGTSCSPNGRSLARAAAAAATTSQAYGRDVRMTSRNTASSTEPRSAASRTVVGTSRDMAFPPGFGPKRNDNGCHFF
jgi:hypothetical protein